MATSATITTTITTTGAKGGGDGGDGHGGSLIAAALIEDGAGRVLVATRPAGAHLAGKHEFPGGKVRADETPEEACVRECREELGVTVSVVGAEGPRVTHAYAEKTVELCFLRCKIAAGSPAPRALASSGLQWVDKIALPSLDWPEANRPLVERLARERGLASLRDGIVLARTTLQGNMHRARVLEEKQERLVILAGDGKFDALWARDGCYASLGALAINRADAARGTLEALLDHQLPDGRIPRRMAKDSAEWAAIRYGMGLHRSRSAHFDTVDKESHSHAAGISGVICPDSNLLVPIVARDYVERAGDDAFLERYWGRLEKCMRWLEAQKKQGFIDQEPYSDWKDTANRGRRPFYNQALLFATTRAMADLDARRGDATGAAKRRAQADALASAARAAYWDDRRGLFKDSEECTGFSPDGNLIAVAFGMTTDAETARIFAQADLALERCGPLLPASFPLYEEWRVPWVVRAVGLRHYHDGFAWPWQDAMLALAAIRVGDRPRALRALGAVAAVASRDQGFFEVYEGNPPAIVSRMFYKSEPRFSWSSGLFLRAARECGLEVQ